MELVYQPVSLSLPSFTNNTNRYFFVINVFTNGSISPSQIPALYDGLGNQVGLVSTVVLSSSTASVGVVVSFQPFVLPPNWSVRASIPLGVQAIVLDSLEDLRGLL